MPNLPWPGSGNAGSAKKKPEVIILDSSEEPSDREQSVGPTEGRRALNTGRGGFAGSGLRVEIPVGGGGGVRFDVGGDADEPLPSVEGAGRAQARGSPAGRKVIGTPSAKMGGSPSARGSASARGRGGRGRAGYMAKRGGMPMRLL